MQTSELIDELWEGGPPASAMTTLQTYIYKLRKILIERGAGDLLCTRPGGYLLAIPDASLDLHRVEQAAREGQARLEDGDPAGARELLNSALVMWRGPALADVDQGGLLSSYATRLEEFRSRTLELRIEADLQLGRHRGLISELKSLVLTHPLHEHLHASLMTALYRSGRRHEALEVYRVLRANMIEDLGLEPGQELKQLHQDLLSDAPLGVSSEPRQAVALPPGDAADEGPDTPASPATPSPSPRLPRPAQLPPDIADFTGRTTLLDRITSDFGAADPESTRTATRIAVIAGMPGVGKTALAINLAHRLRPHFDDGQLYAELNGSGGAKDISDVLHGFLRALGVPESDIPAGTDERSALFRSATAGRRLLVFLDDALSQSDLRAVLPGDPRCAVILTSRTRMHGLTGCATIDLDVMDRAESVELLARTIGRARVEQDRTATDALVDLVGGLPLALRCIGSRLATLPALPLARMVEQLRSSRRVLDELRIGDLDVRSRYDSSYENLRRADQGLFRLLSMLPTAEFTSDTVAELLGWEVAVVERALERLVEVYLVTVVRCGGGEVRYAFPALTREFARERLASRLAQHEECGAARFSVSTDELPHQINGHVAMGRSA